MRRRPPIPKNRRHTRWRLNKARPRGGFGRPVFIQLATAEDGSFAPISAIPSNWRDPEADTRSSEPVGGMEWLAGSPLAESLP
jgi:hypothetical protein